MLVTCLGHVPITWPTNTTCTTVNLRARQHRAVRAHVRALRGCDGEHICALCFSAQK